MLVVQDIDGIQQAALELLSASLNQKNVEMRLRMTQSDDLEKIAKLVPSTQLSPGYHEWALYLFWLESVQLDPDFADEMDGLLALRRARHHFEEENPVCSGCGKRTRRGVKHLCPAQMKGGF
ncbi:MAG TPA: hypothetical protein VFL42_07375 [Terriglobales bacterium]|nr:hypothetical protein [Terriglobales bacterium]